MLLSHITRERSSSCSAWEIIQELCKLRVTAYTTNVFVFVLFFFDFFETGCLSPGCPGTSTIDPADLTLTEIRPPLPPECWD